MLAQLVSGSIDGQDIFWALAVIIFLCLAVYDFVHKAWTTGAMLVGFVFVTIGLMFLT